MANETSEAMKFFLNFDYNIRKGVVALEEIKEAEAGLNVSERWILRIALKESATAGRADAVRWFLSIGVERDWNDYATFWNIVARGHKEVVKVILEIEGFEPDWKSLGMCADFRLWPSINTLLYVVNTRKQFNRATHIVHIGMLVQTRLWLFWNLLQGTVRQGRGCYLKKQWKDDAYYDQNLAGLILSYVD